MNKKKLYIVIMVILMLIQVPLNIFAHSGRTDSSGGHYNRSTGEYHYHHGYKAHQHIDGICPYDNDNKEKSDSSENIKNDVVISTEKEENNFLEKICGIFIGFWWIIIPLVAGVYNYIKEKFMENKKNTQNNTIKENSATLFDKKEENVKNNINQSSNNKYICPRCGGRLSIKHGKYGAFIGCQNYPKCKYTKNIKK